MEAKPDSCKGCPLYSTPGPVWGEGDLLNAKLIYIAQNPGQEEVREGHPLIGPSGRVFNRQLAEAGIRRSELFITNVVKCLTPGNRSPTDEEINRCKHFADAELLQAKADTVVLAGAVAFKTFIGNYSTLSPNYHPRTRKGQPVSIMERMGCVEQLAGRKWIGTLHPAHIMRLPTFRQDAVEHLKKAAAVAGVKIPLPKVEVVEDDTKILDYANLARGAGMFADDVETHQEADVEEDDYVGGDYSMDMCGFSAERYHAIVIKPSKVHLWGDVFSNPLIIQFEHNGEYDRYHLEQICPQRNHRFDTMLATHYLRSYAPKVLKPYVVAKYTNLPYYNRDIEQVDRYLYCGLDNIATLLAGRQQALELREWGLYDLFMEVGMQILPLLEQQRRVGVNVDARKVLLFRKVMEAKIAKAQELFGKMLGPFFNPDSPKQVNEVLYEKWKLPRQYNFKEGKQILTSDSEARKRLVRWIERGGEAHKEAHQQAHIFLLLSDYLAGEIAKLAFLNRVSPDSRIHAFFKAHGTKVFRLSSKPNLQNFPTYDVGSWGVSRAGTRGEDPTGTEKKELGNLRSIVIPDHPDDLILSCDFSSMQLWIYAIQWNCKWLLGVHDRGEYLYGYFYESMHKEAFFEPGKPPKKAFKMKNPPCGADLMINRLRRIKAIPLGYLFGRQPEAIAIEHGIPLSEARAGYNWWNEMNPELRQSYSQIEFRLKQKGWFRYPFGAVMHFPDQKLNDAIASFAQVPEAFITQESMILIDREFKKHAYKNTRIMLSVHDSLSFNIGGARSDPFKLIEVYEEIVKPIMERPIKQLKGFCFSHEAEVGAMWDYKTIDFDHWKEEVLSAGETTKGTTN
jgi:DNA polymerase